MEDGRIGICTSLAHIRANGNLQPIQFNGYYPLRLPLNKVCRALAAVDKRFLFWQLRIKLTYLEKFFDKLSY